VITLPTNQCLNCGAAEEEVPLVKWHYQGRRFWICADCLPVMIHKRHLLAEKLSALGDPDAKEG
jgi:hypothetical protein